MLHKFDIDWWGLFLTCNVTFKLDSEELNKRNYSEVNESDEQPLNTRSIRDHGFS